MNILVPCSLNYYSFITCFIIWQVYSLFKVICRPSWHPLLIYHHASPKNKNIFLHDCNTIVIPKKINCESTVEFSIWSVIAQVGISFIICLFSLLNKGQVHVWHLVIVFLVFKHFWSRIDSSPLTEVSWGIINITL